VRRTDFDKLTLGDAWIGVRHLSLLIASYRAGEKSQSDRAVANFVRRIEEAEAWLKNHGLVYGAALAASSGEGPE
jgi:hypothetical protein